MTMHAKTPHLARAVMALILAAPLSALAGPQEKEKAQEHVARAMEAHGKSDFTTALLELEAAYALDPLPDLLYAIGQVYVQLNRCPEAIEYYEKFLATKPAKQAAADTKQAIQTCQAKEPPPPPPPDPEPQPPPPPPPVVLSTAKPWYKDPIGDALVIGGVAAGVVGAIMYTGARSDLDKAETAMNIQEYDDLVDGAKSKRMYSVILAGGSVVLIGAGIARFMLRDGGSNQETRNVGVVPAKGGGLVTWTGRF